MAFLFTRTQLFIVLYECKIRILTFFLPKAVADVEKAVVEALDKQYADVLSPLKENLAPKKFGLKYVQKLAKRSASAYTVPDEVCATSQFSNFLVSDRHYSGLKIYSCISAGNYVEFSEEDG